jgi:phosphoribosylformylglycinamidine synthase
MKEAGRSLAFVCDCNGHHVWLDPHAGTAGQVAECARNLACVGAEPVGLSDCMNFGNPEKPEIMWEFSASVDGMAEACRELAVPVVSGNVSLYNETEGSPILPTPGLAMVGLVPGEPRRVSGRFPRAGLEVALLGEPGAGHLGGSLYAREILGQPRRGSPPPVDWAAERALHRALRDLVRTGGVEAAHDLSDGGLLVAVAEMCVGGIGGEFSLPEDVPSLFGEDHGRALVAYEPAQRARVEAAGVPVRRLGVTAEGVLVVNHRAADLADLVARWRDSFPTWAG